ncbi:MAG: ZIP family metal transporter [Gemmatimonadaceae bacterium]
MTRAELLYALAAAAANILGALTVTTGARWGLRAIDLMLAFAAGFLISVALLDLFPEAIRRTGEQAAAVALVGYLLVHLTQHTIAKHFHFGEETHAITRVVSVSALVGLLLHTFVDGVAVASGARVSDALGMLVFLAVVLHKLPEGLAISSLFMAAGAGKRAALAAAGLLGAATIAGVFVTARVGPLATHGLALSAGVTLYVGASNLVPEFQAKAGWQVPVSFFAGCALYVAARYAAGA